jgi:pteridine reductase
MVAGATGTLGRAICQALLERGDAVVAVARGRERLKQMRESLDGPWQVRFEPMAADLSRPASVERTVRTALRSAPVDDLVLCMGPFVRTPLESLTRAALLSLFEVHAVAPMLLVRALGDSLAASSGAVVALSDEGVGRPYPNHSAYLAAKGALDAGMRALAVELAPDVRINVLRPGIVTDPHVGRSGGRAQRLSARSLLARFGTPGEVAHVVLAMLDASWLSGQSWTVG